jgi:hypothetical protein
VGQPRLELAIPVGAEAGAYAREALGELCPEVDAVLIEQIAMLVGALASGGQDSEPSATFACELWTQPGTVSVRLRDREFARHRSDGGLVELERSMVTGWRLRLVERLADRWFVAHDDGLTLCFEFDTAPHRDRLTQTR